MSAQDKLCIIELIGLEVGQTVELFLKKIKSVFKIQACKMKLVKDQVFFYLVFALRFLFYIV